MVCFPKMCLNPCAVCFCGPCMIAYCFIGNLVSILATLFRSTCWLCGLGETQPLPDHDLELGGFGSVDTRLMDVPCNYSI